MNSVPDFTDTELWVIRSTLKERYGEEVEVQLADAELRLDPLRPTLTSCPAAIWEGHGATFAVFKSGDQRYRAQFFFRVHQQYGTGIPEFDDIAECVTTLLQVQADHLSENDHDGTRESR